MFVKVPCTAKCREYAAASPAFQAATSSLMILCTATSRDESATVVITATTARKTINITAREMFRIGPLAGGTHNTMFMALSRRSFQDCHQAGSWTWPTLRRSRAEQSPYPSSPTRHEGRIYMDR